MSDEIPPEVFAAQRKLWEDPRSLIVSMRPRDAWVAVAVIQFASRNPQLGGEQRAAAVRVGRALQHALTMLDPDSGRYLEEGWDPRKDVPR